MSIFFLEKFSNKTLGSCLADLTTTKRKHGEGVTFRLVYRHVWQAYCFLFLHPNLVLGPCNTMHASTSAVILLHLHTIHIITTLTLIMLLIWHISTTYLVERFGMPEVWERLFKRTVLGEWRAGVWGGVFTMVSVILELFREEGRANELLLLLMMM